MIGYKDIINYSIIRSLREKMNDACIIFNNLVKKDNVDKRESEYYEVYVKQYREDMSNLKELRDRCMRIADDCNRIMFDMNVYNIKQYYLDPNELSEYEDTEGYVEQLPASKEIQQPEENKEPTNEDEDDMW